MTKIDTLMFGELEVDTSKTWTFSQGLPGFEEYTRFALLTFDDTYPLLWLQALEAREVCLPLIDTFEALPSYSFDIDDETERELGLTADGDGQLFVYSVIVLPEDATQATANLAAPVLFNSQTCVAKQVLLSTKAYSVREPIFAELSRLAKARVAEKAEKEGA